MKERPRPTNQPTQTKQQPTQPNKHKQTNQTKQAYTDLERSLELLPLELLCVLQSERVRFANERRVSLLRMLFGIDRTDG